MNLILPRQKDGKHYISYTQYALWKSSPKSYIKNYFTGKPFTGNKYTAYGNEVHKMIESGNHPFANMPDFEISEKEIFVEIEGFNTLSYIDGFSSRTNTVFELKTGKKSWTQKRVDKHDQLVFYAMAVQQAFGSYDHNVTLVWLETKDIVKDMEIGGVLFEGAEKVPGVTGRIEIFKRNISNTEVADMRRDVIKVAREIHKDYEDFRNSLILD